MTQELAGLKINGRIRAPIPFSGLATIIGFRYYTGRHSGRTSMVADYVTDDGKASFDPIEKLLPLRLDTPAPAEALLQAAAEIADEIDAFDKECASAEYTDTGEVWELMHRWRDMLRAVAPKVNTTPAKVTA